MKTRRLGRNLAHHLPFVGAALGVTLFAAFSTGALTSFFAQDDITYLARAAQSRPWPGLVRCLSTGVAFSLGHWAFGLNPLGYHVLNLVLHLLNVVGVYMLAQRIGLGRREAGAAGLIFAASVTAFTPLHWVSGIIELLCAFFLLLATLVLRVVGDGRRQALIIVGVTLLAAILSKETAVGWPLAMGAASGLTGWPSSRWRAFVPVSILAVCLAWSLVEWGHSFDTTAAGAYAISFAPAHLLTNLFTYIVWSVDFSTPVRDLHAVPDGSAWRLGLPVVSAAIVLALRTVGTHSRPLRLGLVWWLAFLLPVLPLSHHSYLYYLYIPWIGASLFLSRSLTLLVDRLPRSWRTFAGAILVLGLVGLEISNSIQRATARGDYLPADKTLREAELLQHALAGIASANLRDGVRIGFVNPAPRHTIATPGTTASRNSVEPQRTSFIPLELAMRGGETTSLFFPRIRYMGFTETIPSDWHAVDCFYYEQRGWLQHWGSGQQALMRQAAVQVAARQWAAAESTYVRVRALGDTLPAALVGQARALRGWQQEGRAREVLEELHHRWPGHARSD